MSYSDDEHVEAPSEADVTEYACTSVKLRLAKEKLDQFRKEHTPRKNELHDNLLSRLDADAENKARRVTVNGEDYVLKLVTRFSVGRITDDALYNAVYNAWGNDDEDEGIVQVPDGDVKKHVESFYKCLHRARSTRKSSVKCLKPTPATAGVSDGDAEFTSIAAEFIKVTDAMQTMREKAKEFMQPLKESMQRAESRVLEAIKAGGNVKLNYSTGTDDLNVSVGMRKRKRVAKKQRTRYTAAMVRDAITIAMQSMAGGSFKADDAVDTIKSALKDVMAEVNDAELSGGGEADEKDAATHSIVVRAKRVRLSDEADGSEDDYEEED